MSADCLLQLNKARNATKSVAERVQIFPERSSINLHGMFSVYEVSVLPGVLSAHSMFDCFMFSYCYIFTYPCQ